MARRAIALILSVYQSAELPAGKVGIKDGLPTGGFHALRLGCLTVKADVAREAPHGELWLAPDLWTALAVPYEGIRLQARPNGMGELELGPSLTVLYAGRQERQPLSRLLESATFYYEPWQGYPGLLAFGFDESIDWERSLMHGYVMDSRPGHAGEIVAATYPIPAVVRLAWAIRPDVIRRLRQVTDERCFNWVRNIGKWQFHRLLSAEPAIAPHLPQTRLLTGIADLAAMLARFDTLFVKHVFSIKGQGVVRIRQAEESIEIRHMEGKSLKETQLHDLNEVWGYLRHLLPSGRRIVQEAIPVAGAQGRALHFRILVVRDRFGQWHTEYVVAHVAPDTRLVFTNIANGATDEEPLRTLQEHYGMTEEQARERLHAMIDLCILTAGKLQVPFHPLGMLGFDVAVSARSHELFLLEANSVPGTSYGPPIGERLGRSQIEYGLSLTDFCT